MIRSVTRRRWVVVLILFLFLILHQVDLVLIGPLAFNIMLELNIDEDRFFLIQALTTLVVAVFYFIWGYLFDTHTRKKLIALGGFIWGATAWLRVIAPTFATFLVSQAASGVDDAIRPGIFSIVGDYFRPWNRGKIFGLLQLTQPVADLVAMILALVLGSQFGWRPLFLLTGLMGLLMAFMVYFGVIEPKRGVSDPEFSSFLPTGTYTFDWVLAKKLLRKPSLILLYLQSFFAIFPWTVVMSSLLIYLGEVRGYSTDEMQFLLMSLFLVLALGYPIGGIIGDSLFTYDKRCRICVSLLGVVLSAVGLFFVVGVPVGQNGLFMLLMMLTAFFMPFARPNLLATIFDITLPEVRSTALAIFMFFQLLGSFVAGLLASYLMGRMDLVGMIRWLGVLPWGICVLLLVGVLILLPKEIRQIHRHMAYRSYLESRLAQKRQIHPPK